MAVNVISFIITLLAEAVFAFAAVFFMIVALNGYSESDAAYGIVAFAALALAIILVTSALASFSTGGLIRRGYKAWLAVPIAVVVFSFLGFIFIGIAGVLGAAVAEIARINF